MCAVIGSEVCDPVWCCAHEAFHHCLSVAYIGVLLLFVATF